MTRPDPIPDATPEGAEIRVDEILAEMDELGRAKWETACARVENRYLRRELAKLTNEQGRGPVEGPVAGT